MTIIAKKCYQTCPFGYTISGLNCNCTCGTCVGGVTGYCATTIDD